MKLTALIATAVLLAAGSASAATMTFDNRTTFDAGVSGTVQDFNNIPAFPSPRPSLALDTFTVTQSTPNAGVQTNAFVNSRNPNFANGDVRLGVADRPGNLLTFDAFAPGTSAFGLDIFSDVAGTLSVAVTTTLGTTTSLLTVGRSTLEDPISSFFGITDDAGILSVAFNFPDPSSSFSLPTVDNVFVGAIAPVPLPAALPMLLLGLGGLGLMSRRRKTA